MPCGCVAGGDLCVLEPPPDGRVRQNFSRRHGSLRIDNLRGTRGAPLVMVRTLGVAEGGELWSPRHRMLHLTIRATFARVKPWMGGSGQARAWSRDQPRELADEVDPLTLQPPPSRPARTCSESGHAQAGSAPRWRPAEPAARWPKAIRCRDERRTDCPPLSPRRGLSWSSATSRPLSGAAQAEVDRRQGFVTPSRPPVA